MYLTDLRHLVKNCNFCNCLCDTLLRDRIVMGIHDNETRKRLLDMKDLALDQCVDVCRAYEATETCMQSIATENPLKEVHSVRRTLPHLHPEKIYDGDRTHNPHKKRTQHMQMLWPATRNEERIVPCVWSGMQRLWM